MRKRSILALCLAGVLMMQSGAALAAEIDISDSEDVTEEIVISDDVEEGAQPVEDVQEEQAEESVQAITVEDGSIVDSGTCGDNLTWTLDDTGTLTISGTGAMTNYSNEVESPWSWNDKIRTVVIKNGVTSIGDYAFLSCDSLTSVTIPDSVTSIGNRAFWDCDSLTSVTIPNSVTSIGDSAFSECHSLTSVTIPDSVTSIGEGAFCGCESLTSVTIPNSVTSIGSSAFAWCESLTSITVDSGNPSFSSQNGVLYNKAKTTLIQYPIGNSQTTFTIPNSVTSIGECAFYECYNLTSVTIPNSVTSIGGAAFSECESLTSVTIGNSVTSIGDRAFEYCESLTSVTIGNSVTSIGEDAFLYCHSLTSVTIPNSVTSIGEDAFYNCSALTSVTIGNSVTSIGEGAFWYCRSLTSVTIPNSVTSIGHWAFDGCKSLKSIYFAGKLPSIGTEAFEEVTATAYYPSTWTSVPSPTAYGGNITWVPRSSHTHTWDSGKVTKAATCKETGVKTYTCKVCGETKTETIAKLTTHTWDGGKVTKAATCGTAGVKTYTCSVCKTTRTEAIPATGNHTYNTTTTKAKPGANGKTVTKCSVCGTVKSTTTIYAPKTLTLSATSYTYNGKAQKPTVKVKDSKGNTISSTHYTVSYASGRKYVGSYKVTVKFRSTSSKYSGTLSTYFKINPKGTTLKTPTAGSKSFTAKWAKQSTQTSGYQLQYSTSSKFTNAKTVTITSNKTTSKKITKLSAKKKYYVRVRTYKTVSGKKYYSSWSSAKAVTTKK